MGRKLVVAVTDSDWFEMLRWDSSLSEVNFWSPSPKNFSARQPSPKLQRNEGMEPRNKDQQTGWQHCQGRVRSGKSKRNASKRANGDATFGDCGG